MAPRTHQRTRPDPWGKCFPSRSQGLTFTRELQPNGLHPLKIAAADKILCVADGARWIWNRVGAMSRSLGIKPEQINELVDFYHAVEHLGKIAALQRRWTVQERQTWIGRQRRRLLKGKLDEVTAAIDV